MSNQEVIELSSRLRHGLEIAEKRMHEEKALMGQDVIVCDEKNNIKRIPTKLLLT